MGNFVSVLSHCWGRGFEVLMGDQSHIHLDEQGGMAQVCGMLIKKVVNCDPSSAAYELCPTYTSDLKVATQASFGIFD